MAGTLLFNALKEAIDEEMANDVNVCVMGEDVGQYGGSYKVTKDLYEILFWLIIVMRILKKIFPRKDH